MYVIHAWLNTKTTLSQSLQCHHYAVFHCTVFVHMLALLKFVDQNLWYLHCSIRVLKHSTFRLSMSLSSWQCNQLKFDMHHTNWFKGHFPDESGQVSFSLSDDGLLAAIADASDWLDVIHYTVTDWTWSVNWLASPTPLHSFTANIYWLTCYAAEIIRVYFSAPTLLVGRQQGHLACKNYYHQWLIGWLIELRFYILLETK